MFYNQLLILCEKENIKPTTLLKELGMSKGSLANWKDGKLPSGDVLVRFSEHFNVSLDFLVHGRNESPILSIDDSDWLSLIHQLPHDAQLEFKGELKGYIKCLDKRVAPEEPIRKAK